MPYSEFEKALAEGRVAEVVVGETTVTGRLKSPDGSKTVIVANRVGIFTIAADRTGQRQLTRDGGWPVWWPDGRTIGHLVLDDAGDQQLRKTPSGGGTPRVLTAIRLVGTNRPFPVTRNVRSILITSGERLADEIWLLRRGQ